MGFFELVAPNFTSKGGEGWTEAPSECLVDVVQVLYLHGTCFYAATAVHSREAQLYFVACACVGQSLVTLEVEEPASCTWLRR